MKKMTLLEMTQNILSAMNSDEVNSINDTVEALQVAEEIRNTFYQLFTNKDLPEFRTIIHLESIGDPDRPNILRIPNDVATIDWIKYYDARNGTFNDVAYINPEEFLYRVVLEGRSTSAPFVESILSEGSPITYAVTANVAPRFYTVLEDPTVLVFDAFDAERESSLSGSNSLAWGIKNFDFTLTDDFIPPIDANLFPLLLAEAKSACFITIKEVANSKEEQRARRQAIRAQQNLHRTDEQYEGVFSGSDYSRKRGARFSHRRYYSSR